MIFVVIVSGQELGGSAIVLSLTDRDRFSLEHREALEAPPLPAECGKITATEIGRKSSQTGKHLGDGSIVRPPGIAAVINRDYFFLSPDRFIKRKRIVYTLALCSECLE